MRWLLQAAMVTLFALAIGVVAAYLWGTRFYVVMSGSMEPAIATGSICIVNTNAVYEEVREQEVIAFWQEGNLVAHRVISVTEEGLETKGDANGMSDGITTTQDNFHGVVVRTVPRVGYAVHLFQQPMVRWSLVMWLVAALLWEMIGKR